MKRERLERLTELQRAITAERYERRIGRTVRGDRRPRGRRDGESTGATVVAGRRHRRRHARATAVAAPGTIVDACIEDVVDDYDFAATHYARARAAAPMVAPPARARARLPVMAAAIGSFGQLRPVSVAARRRSCAARAPLMPGGVNSPVRAFGGVGGEPFVVARGEGARIWDADGKEYIDFVLSWGPLVLGHAAPAVLDALDDAMRRGTSFGIPTELEVELAELMRERMPHVEMMRFVSSGTEATMSALRLARAATGRDAILKFDGCYHGHARFLSRARRLRRRDARPSRTRPACPMRSRRSRVTAPFNDLDAARALSARDSRLAAIIVEPVVGNAGFIPPDPGFLQALRAIADRHGRAADLRRGDDGLSHRAGRRARALRRHGRSHDARQGDRRRAARSPRTAAVAT